MKIIFIGGRDIHTIGGIESYMYNLATSLKEKGYEPVVFCESDRNEVEYVNGFKVVHNKSIGGRYLCKILLGHKATAYALFKEREAKPLFAEKRLFIRVTGWNGSGQNIHPDSRKS